MDNIFMLSMFQKAHIEHVQQGMVLLQDVGATIDLDKCAFFTDSKSYKYPTISPGQLAVLRHTINAICILEAPF